MNGLIGRVGTKARGLVGSAARRAAGTDRIAQRLDTFDGRQRTYDSRLKRFDERLKRLAGRVGGVEEQAEEVATHRQKIEELSELRTTARETRSLTARVAELEAEVQECRALNRRIAELTDLVAEVLVPAVDRDEAKLRERLVQYQQHLNH